jgi:replication initiation and membrane attachment protein
MIYTFETLSPYDFLRGKYNGANPTSRDMQLVETLLVDLELSPGVVNVLIDYVLKIKDHKLTKNYVEAIAGQWKRLSIKTVEEAMNQAETEHKKYKHKEKYSTKKVIDEKVPDWFDKKIEASKPSDEEEEKLKAILSEFS